jgi:hypothetical protein
VVHKDHRGRYRVDLVGRGGTHVTIGPTRGYGSIDEAMQAANEEAHRRGILDGVIFDGDRDLLQIGHAGGGYPTMRDNPSYTSAGWIITYVIVGGIVYYLWYKSKKDKEAAASTTTSSSLYGVDPTAAFSLL